MGNVDDEIAGVAILFTDAEHHAAGHPALHQAQVTKPDRPVADPGMDFVINHRKDHCVIVGFDVVFQQRQFGGRPHCRFLAGNELLGQGRVRLRIRCLKKCLHTGLILRADIQLAAEREELRDRHIKGRDFERTWRRRFDHKPRPAMKSAWLTFGRFKVMQCRLQQRKLQHLERIDLNLKIADFQRSPQTYQGFVDVGFDPELILQRLAQ
ncbi:hypothetical protein D3C86_1535250 [compost metagenome]